MIKLHHLNRREFLQKSGVAALGAAFLPQLACSSGQTGADSGVRICAHLWVYASKFPPDWDATPALETMFSDLSYAKIEGLELMESILRYDDSVERLKGLIDRYGVPVSGSSYGVGFSMWDPDQHKKIMDDIHLVIPRLAAVGGETFGISVGSKPELKTDADLDAQAKLLVEIRTVCEDNGITPNLHNHTYEVENDLHDLKGTLERIPDFKLGPDINWLIRGGVDPVEFINTYGDQIVYLHIRDQYADGTWSEYVGQGDTDFAPIAKALNEKNFSGIAAIELAFPQNFTPENELKVDWQKSREFVEETFGW